MKQPTSNHFWKVNGSIILVSVLLTSLALIFKESLYGIFGEQNYVVIHLIIEIFLIATSLTIAMQTWFIFPHILSNHRLWLGALLSSICLFEVFHTISYKGMPFFLTEASPYAATWFYVIGRLTQVIGFLIILMSKEKEVSINMRWVAYLMAFIYSLIWIFIIYSPIKWLPELVIEGTGTTLLKNSLQYAFIGIQVFFILFLFRKFKSTSNDAHSLMLLIATGYLIISDSMFTTYVSVYDIANFMGHVFQVAGFYFIMRAFYHSSVIVPFNKEKEAQEQMKHMAFHDQLTKLPNINFLIEVMKEDIDENPETKKALLLIDIDRFKKINESLGHAFGDSVIQSVSWRLSEILSAQQFLSHMGGDKFIVFLSHIKDNEEVLSICNQIQFSMNSPFQIDHMQLKIVLNIGATIYPDHGKDNVELLKNAQIAMEESKKEVNRYKFYHPNMDQLLLDRLVLEQDLHKALPNKELYIVYQPQVDLHTGQIFALEALLRWKHPKRGEISPGEFIPIAEDTGLMIPIGEWVLRESCKQLKSWHDQGKPPINVCVNLSIRQFFQQNLVEMIQDILEETGLPPRYLELEITESMTIDIEHTNRILNELKKLGVKIAIDDFGTGYSSLNYLSQLSIDRLKIDRSFITDILGDKREAAMISMIVSIANHLNIEVIAEGVEYVEQLQYLQQQDCWQVQGYIFSRPISSEILSKRFNEMQKRFILLLDKETGAIR